MGFCSDRSFDSVNKGKEDHTPTGRWWGAHLPFYGREPVGG